MPQQFVMVMAKTGEELVKNFIHTVEVGSLQTLRLESLKQIFKPLHKFLVKYYSFGKLVRTSTLCMTQLFTDRLFDL
jgi:hypothetical protein